MNDDILFLLDNKKSGFSKGQRRIAAVITESYDKAAFMTASRLGELAGVSESTVVRFAVELGFDGYPQMQKAMQEMVLNRLTSVQRIGVTNDRMADRDVVSMVLQADIDKLRQTDDTVDRNAFEKSVEAILKARHIYVIGARSASALARFFGYYLNYMFDNVHTVTNAGTGEMLERLAHIGHEDVVIAFSFPRYSTSTIKAVEYCRHAGATVVGITNTSLSPLGQICDYVLIAKSDMVSMVDSLVAPLSLVNALIVALAQPREGALAKTFDTLEHIWEDYNIYEKQVDTV